MKLLVVESPAKARTLKKYLPEYFEVLASVGHIKNLPKSRLGVTLDGSFEPEYKLIPGKKKVVDEIVSKAKEAEAIYLAPDPDREGEAIAAHLSEEIRKKIKNPKIYRVLMREITQRGMQEALDSPSEINMMRYESQQARRVLDRIVGYQISPLLWEKVMMGTSAGRVQSVALRLTIERERAIASFVSQEYHRVFGDFDVGGQKILRGELTECEGEKFIPRESPWSQDELTQKIRLFQNTSWHIAEISHREKQKNPPLPFITSTLQIEASSKLRFSPKKTMTLAQMLYEGVELGELGTQGLITYMRTDSTRIAQEAAEQAKSWVLKTWGPQYLPSGEPTASAKKGGKIQDAHEAIRPVDITLTPDILKPHLEPDIFELYQLIWKRFVASQMASSLYKLWQVKFTDGNRNTFSHSKQSLLFDGFRTLWIEEEEETQVSALQEQDYSSLAANTVTPLTTTEITTHHTEPPPRFSEASLIKELELRGIGRPSTYASIMSTILERRYVEKIKSKLIPTALGCVICDLLTEHFTHIMDYDFTANMEQALDLIETGEAKKQQVLSHFYKEFQATLEKAKQEMQNIKTREIPTDIRCNLCGSIMVIRWGRRGEFLSCSSYPTCRNARNFTRNEQGGIVVEEPKIAAKPCPTCGKHLIERLGRYGRYLACQDYPQCNTTLPFPIGIPCPTCSKGDVVERRSKRGRMFYGCGRYPECQFVSWQKPIPSACPACQHPFMVEKETKKLGFHHFCPQCKHAIPLADTPQNVSSSD